MNGAVSNLAVSASTMGALGHELRNGGYDVVHVHEPNVPAVSWFAVEASQVPVVGTFHTYSTSRVVNGIAANLVGARRLYGKLSARIAVSEAAAWTARRYYGGRYRIVPNGVDLAAARPQRSPGDDLEILFIGRAEGRKGLPILLRAFEALRGAGIGARLTIAGVPAEEVEPLLLDPEGVNMVGRVTEEEKWRLLGSVDLLCAPSLGGESFGMVLTEAFASGTPVVASDIAGYRDVVRDGVDGMLVPAGDAVELGEALGALASDPSSPRADGGRRARARGALCMAARGRRGHRGVRAGRRRAATRDRHGPRGAARRSQARGARTASGTGAAAVARARGRGARPAQDGEARPEGAHPRRGRGRRGPDAARARAAGHRVDRPRSPRRHAGMGARGVHAHVPLDAGPRRGLERDSARRAARHSRAAPRHRPRDDGRRPDVGHPARPPGRALARSDRVAQAGPDARSLPGGARHARLADDAQHPRAVRARRRHVRHRRRVQPRRGRAGDRHDRAGGAARAGGLGALDPAQRQAVALPARAAGRCRGAPRNAPGPHRSPGVQATAARAPGP